MNEELNQIEEAEERTFEDMSKDELLEVVYQLLQEEDNSIPVNTENVQDFELNQQEFKAGVDSVSFMAGQLNALVSAGFDKTSAIDVILNERNIEYNLQLNEMTCTSNEKQAKYQQDQNQV